MPPIEINTHTYWERERIIFDIVNKCFKQYTPVKVVTSDGKKYSLTSYETHLDKLAETYKNVKHIPNEICSATTIKNWRAGNALSRSFFKTAQNIFCKFV